MSKHGYRCWLSMIRLYAALKATDQGSPITLCYGVYVIVIAWVVAFHWTSSASASAINRRGRSVLPLMMIGTTLGSLSMLTDLPFSVATFLPIHSSNVFW